MNDCRQGFYAHGRIDFCNGCLMAGHQRQEFGIPLMNLGVVRIQLPGPLEFLLGSGKVPIDVEFHFGGGKMARSQRLIQRHRMLRSISRFGVGLGPWGRREERQDDIAVGKCSVCRSVSGIVLQSLLKVLNRLNDVCPVTPSEEFSPLYVLLESLLIGSRRSAGLLRGPLSSLMIATQLCRTPAP